LIKKKSRYVNQKTLKNAKRQVPPIQLKQLLK